LVIPIKAIITGYVGILLQAAAFLSVGLWASSLTQNQIVAAIVSFALLLILWLSDNLAIFGRTIGAIVSYNQCYQSLSVIPTGRDPEHDVIYYLTLVVAGIVLSTLSLQSGGIASHGVAPESISRRISIESLRSRLPRWHFGLLAGLGAWLVQGEFGLLPRILIAAGVLLLGIYVALDPEDVWTKLTGRARCTRQHGPIAVARSPF